jgi:NCAIR mutase (PurE)-related protein
MTTSLPLGFATVDLDRERRQGLAEVVYGPGKTAGEIAAIVGVLLERSDGPVLVTRLDPDVASTLHELQVGGSYDQAARLSCWRPAQASTFTIALLTAGTSDGPVATEAASVARAIGLQVTEIRDVGVAGVHRLLERVAEVRRADAVIVVAGMEGALSSVVGGLVATPVVAVPTSTGYGAAFEGVTALLAMLSSCAAGVTVVNIDSGFGAAMAAYRLAQSMSARERRNEP